MLGDPVPTARPVNKVHLENLDLWVDPVLKDALDLTVIQDLLDSRDKLDHRGLLELPESRYDTVDVCYFYV